MPLKYRKRTMSTANQDLHHSVRVNLRQLMSEYQLPTKSGKGIGICTTAKLSGIGVGSVQSILKDSGHSPSLRVLFELAQFFGVPVTRLLQAQES
ncbi:MAG: helix-turn-helix domain-containing protein [Candidatus Delongbacteria bacterium]